MSHLCIIGIGSNIDPQYNIDEALSILGREQEVVSVSSLIQTSPIGLVNQPDFLNGAVKVVTQMSMTDFKYYLKNIEDRLNRDRSAPKYGPRTIDLDILIWDGEIVDTDYYNRDFLQTSVSEII